MPVLDTDALTIVQRRTEPQYTRLLDRLRALPSDTVVWTTIVSFEEQMRGWLEYVKRAKPDQLPTAYAKLGELNLDFSTRPILSFDASAARELRRLKASKIRLGTMDLRIAAIVIANGELLLTKNVAHFRLVPNLRVEDWTV